MELEQNQTLYQDNTQTYQATQVKEQVKQGGKPKDLDDETKTQASTMQSLSMENVGGPSGDYYHSFDKVPSIHDHGQHDHFSHEEQRNSIEELSSQEKSEPSLEKLKEGVHKAANKIAKGVETVTNVISSNLPQNEYNPSKDLDQDVKEQLEKVNDEIEHLPHGDEEVIESQGESVLKQSGGDQSKGLGNKIEAKARDLKQSSQDLLSQASNKLEQQKSKMQSQGQNLKEQGQELLDKTSQKASQLKTRIASQLPGQEVNPSKDLDQDVKEQLEKVNEEIEHLPHGDEEIIESQGQSQGQKDLKPETQAIKAQAQEWTNKAAEKVDELQTRGNQGISGLKQSTKGMLEKASEKLEQTKSEVSSQILESKEEINPSNDLTQDMKEQHERVNEEIEQLPPRDENIIESQGQNQESSQESSMKNLSSQASDKLQQGKEALKSQTQGLKEQAQQWTDKASQKVEEIKEKYQPKEGEVSEEISHKIEELAEMFNSQQHPEGHQHHELSKESPSFSPSQQTESARGSQSLQLSQEFLKPEHPEHHLTVSSPSFKPNKKSHLVVEKFERENNSHPESNHHEHHHLSAGSQSFQPDTESKVLVEAVKEALEDDSVTIVDKVEEAEEHLHEGLNQQELDLPKRQKDSSPLPHIEISKATETKEEPIVDEEESEEAFWQKEWKELEQRKIEKQNKSLESLPEKDMIDVVTQSAHDISSNLAQGAHDISSNLVQGAHDISSNISHKIENVKGIFKHEKTEDIKEGETQLKSELNENLTKLENPSSSELEQARVPLLDVVTQGAHDISSSLSHKVDNMKGMFKHEKTEHIPEDEEKGVKLGFGLFAKVSNKLTGLKNKLMSRKEEAEEKTESSEDKENIKS